jgi:hypothetical protein
LEAEGRKLQAETARFAKQTGQWLGLAESFNESLKELGDVENWAKQVEREMLRVAATLEQIHHLPPADAAPYAD